MPNSKKFGTFSGVFTPSILTILGVIMYMRLPWIVGQAGLYMTIAIVALAHVISVTTGLSISSIATDKKVKAGGNYFIISRSLGLSIGGTLGIALFAGLSLSVSLYLIGFCESFLPVIHVPVTKDTIRIAGTIALFSVTTITFISTSLAIKTQFFIMAAIGLSLLSLFIGRHELVPIAPMLLPAAGAAPFMVLFGIFFPAVTGFESGVSMSGDLKDPKKSIPTGTILAVLTGLLVYIGLPVFFAYRVQADALVNDPNVLTKISFFPPLVLAGIWGATISSAMGSILGAPRILQATSADRITPKLFAKGYGKTNEPRNALLLTAVLAEAGILIGELNLIARVVSMFFITAYGFLNAACVIESWASTDFRPSFRIPKTVSIIGSLACIIAMLQLDVLACAGAILILAAIFFILKRKELTLDTGDAWTSVWASIVRTGLARLSNTATHVRNWRPNIVLFSGLAEDRPHLVQLGAWLAGKRGFVTRFELTADGIQGKASRLVRTHNGHDDDSMFLRRAACVDIYDGIQSVVRTYGFSGIDPNTILMGWARKTRNADEYCATISSLEELDFNVLLLDYDREHGFGDKSRIDVWWRGSGPNASLALVLLKFLLASDDWRQAQARLLVVSDDNAFGNRAYQEVTAMLNEQRLDAEVKIISNGIQKRPVPDIIRDESDSAPLTILGFSVHDAQDNAQFYERMNSLLAGSGSALFVHAAPSFNDEKAGAPASPVKAKEGQIDSFDLQDLVPLRLTDHEDITRYVAPFHEKLEQFIAQRSGEYFGRATELEMHMIDEVGALWSRCCDSVREQVDATESTRSMRNLTKIQSDLLFQTRRLLAEFTEQAVAQVTSDLKLGISEISDFAREIVKETPSAFNALFPERYFLPAAGDSKYLARYKRWRRLRFKLTQRPASVKIPFQQAVSCILCRHVNTAVHERLSSVMISALKFATDISTCISDARSVLMLLSSRLDRKELSTSGMESELDGIAARIKNLHQSVADAGRQSHGVLVNKLRTASARMALDMSNILARKTIMENYRCGREQKALSRGILTLPDDWEPAMKRVCDFRLVEQEMMSVFHRLSTIVRRDAFMVRLHIEKGACAAIEDFIKTLETFETESQKNPSLHFSWTGEIPEHLAFEQILDELAADIDAAIEGVTETQEIPTEEAFQALGKGVFNELTTMTLPLRSSVEYAVESRLKSPMVQEISRMPEVFQSALTVLRDADRLLSSEDIGESTATEKKNMIRDTLARIKSEYECISHAGQSLNENVTRWLEELSASLNPYALVYSQLNRRSKKRPKRKMIRSALETAGKRISGWYSSVGVRLFLRKSQGVLLARRFGSSRISHSHIIESLLDFKETSSPPAETVSSLPGYYHRLFAGRMRINKEYWVRRPREISAAEKILERYHEGIAGGILICGAPGAGKSALAWMLANRWIDKARLVSVPTVAGGSSNTDVFWDRMQFATGIHGDLGQVMRSLPEHSIVIIDDVELWWERSRNGLAVVEFLKEMIREWSSRHLFIVSGYTFAIRAINHATGFQNSFAGIVDCLPFGVQEIEEAILLRHHSTGLEFYVNNKAEDEQSPLIRARLFSRLFDYSRGTIGTAFEGWLRFIEKATGEAVTIRSRERPAGEVFGKLDTQWRLWLMQFVLHRQLTIDKCARLLQCPEHDARSAIDNLMRGGMVVHSGPVAYELAPFVRPFICEHLTETDKLWSD